jgi:hypothetical protein
MEMKCIFNIGKNVSILAKVTQVSDEAHGPLVSLRWDADTGVMTIALRTFVPAS